MSIALKKNTTENKVQNKKRNSVELRQKECNKKKTNTWQKKKLDNNDKKGEG